MKEKRKSAVRLDFSEGFQWAYTRHTFAFGKTKLSRVVAKGAEEKYFILFLKTEKLIIYFRTFAQPCILKRQFHTLSEYNFWKGYWTSILANFKIGLIRKNSEIIRHACGETRVPPNNVMWLSWIYKKKHQKSFVTYWNTLFENYQLHLIYLISRQYYSANQFLYPSIDSGDFCKTLSF